MKFNFNTGHGPRLLLVVLALLIPLGCRHKINTQCETASPVLMGNFRVSYPLGTDGYIPDRVLILPNSQSIQPQSTRTKFIEHLATQLRNHRLFEVIVPLQPEVYTYEDEILNGRLRERRMVEIANQHEADAILLYRLNNFAPYGDMTADVSVAIIDVNEMHTVYAADGSWSLSDPATRQNFHHYLRSAGKGNIELRSQSPREFFDYICSQIAQSMAH